MIRCTDPKHSADCEALILVSDLGNYTFTCRTTVDKHAVTYGKMEGWTEYAWPADRPMWIYDGEAGHEYWIDPVTRKEIPAPANRRDLPMPTQAPGAHLRPGLPKKPPTPPAPAQLGLGF